MEMEGLVKDGANDHILICNYLGGNFKGQVQNHLLGKKVF